jgi:hypothetical protein
MILRVSLILFSFSYTIVWMMNEAPIEIVVVRRRGTIRT